MIVEHFKHHVWWRVCIVYVFMTLVMGYPIYAKNNRLAQIQAQANSAQNDFSASSPIDTIQNPISGIPVRLVIPSIGHSVDVIPGTHNLKNQTWTLSSTQAQYATNTQPLNTQSGSTVIYGHNTQAVFGKLSGLKTGDTVLVYTEKGALFAYTLEGSFSTVPTDTSVFDKQGGKPSLQLLTCTGTWSENRRILNLSLKEVR